MAIAAFLAARRERDQHAENPDLWPTFWYLTAGLFAFLALGRAGNLAGIIADVGRQEAVDAGWYDNRRKYQAMAVAVVFVSWFIAVIVAIWRVPERRRRYLPMAIVSSSLVCFAGVRMFSFHHIDSLLYRRQMAGMEISFVLEVLGLVLAFLTTFWQPKPLLERRPQTIGHG